MKHYLLLFITGVFFAVPSGAKAVERYSLGAFYAQGYTCEQAVFLANNQCVSGLQAFSETHEVTGDAACPRFACSCYGGTAPARAVCPGVALFEDGEQYEATRRTAVQRFVGQGYSCWQAMHHARADMYTWAWQLSDRVAVVDFDLRRFGNCSCNQYGTPTATCSASITYLQPKRTR